MNQQHPQSGQHTGLPQHSRLTVAVRGNPVTVAASSSPAEEGSGELVLLVHGLGCNKSAFNPVYTGQDQRRWLAIDLPGHGQSPPVAAQRDLIGFYADLVSELVRQLGHRTVHLVGHSMGGAVALLAANTLPTGALVSIEGNLTGEDCGLVSRQIAAQSRSEFVRAGFAGLRERLLADAETGVRIWGNWIEHADPATVWEAAAALVTWCDSGALAARWPRMHRRTYLWGERSGYPEHLRSLLGPGGAHQIPFAAHFAMVDNPIGLADAITAAIDGHDQTGTA